MPETGDKPTRYNFLMGRGWGAVDKITRRLEDGILPILHGTLIDDDITYNLTAFVTLESKPLTAGNRARHAFPGGRRLRPRAHVHQGTAGAARRALPAEMNQPEETVLYVRISAVNTAAVPRYAFFKNPVPSATRAYGFDGTNGLAAYKTGACFRDLPARMESPWPRRRSPSI